MCAASGCARNTCQNAPPRRASWPRLPGRCERGSRLTAVRSERAYASSPPSHASRRGRHADRAASGATSDRAHPRPHRSGRHAAARDARSLGRDDRVPEAGWLGGSKRRRHLFVRVGRGRSTSRSRSPVTITVALAATAVASTMSSSASRDTGVARDAGATRCTLRRSCSRAANELAHRELLGLGTPLEATPRALGQADGQDFFHVYDWVIRSGRRQVICPVAGPRPAILIVP
jgi:hypothetical protein